MKISHKVTLGGVAIGVGAVVVSLGIAIAAPTGAAATGVHAGQFSAVGPVRILDTRHGLGATRAPVGPGHTLVLPVGGGAVPASGVSAVVLNITETNPTQDSFLTVYADGQPRPSTSNLNFAARSTLAASVTVQVSAAEKIDIFNQYGSVDVIADITGYFVGNDSAATGIVGDYTALTPPVRLVDSRHWQGQHPALHYLDGVGVGYSFEDPTLDIHVTALAVNITVVGPTAAGYLTAWNGAGAASGGSPPPNTSVVNFPAGRTVPNFAIIPTLPCQQVWLPTQCGSPQQVNAPEIFIEDMAPGGIELLVDVIGLFDDGALPGSVGDGARFQPLTPTRIVDSRVPTGIAGPLGPDQTATVDVGSPADDHTLALSVNMTAVAPTASTFLSFWPTGPLPIMSTLNTVAAQTVANAAITALGPGNVFNAYNYHGTTGLLVDVNGRYELPATATPSPGTSSMTRLDGTPGGSPGHATTPHFVPHGG